MASRAVKELRNQIFEPSYDGVYDTIRPTELGSPELLRMQFATYM